MNCIAVLALNFSKHKEIVSPLSTQIQDIVSSSYSLSVSKTLIQRDLGNRSHLKSFPMHSFTAWSGSLKEIYSQISVVQRKIYLPLEFSPSLVQSHPTGIFNIVHIHGGQCLYPLHSCDIAGMCWKICKAVVTRWDKVITTWRNLGDRTSYLHDELLNGSFHFEATLSVMNGPGLTIKNDLSELP